MKPIVVAFVLACLTATGAGAAPFGISQGTPIKGLKVEKRYGTKQFIVIPPRPNPKFVEYHATATPLHGVCAIVGITERFNGYRAAYQEQNQIKKLLSRYGKPNRVRFGPRAPILHMSPDEGPVQWKGPLPDGLTSIILETVEGDGAFFVEIQYFYRNMSRCENWEPAQNRTGL